MMKKEYDVVVVVSVDELGDKEAFDKHLRREGLREIDGEPFAYKGVSSTPIINTRAYLADVFKKALKKAGNFKNFSMIVQLGDNPMEVYKYKDLN